MNRMENIIFTIRTDDLANESRTLYYRPLTGKTSFSHINHCKKETLPILRMSSINDTRMMSFLPNNICNENVYSFEKYNNRFVKFNCTGECMRTN